MRRPKWFEKTLREAREHTRDPRTMARVSKPLRQFPTYMALMIDIIDSKYSSFEEVASQSTGVDRGHGGGA